MSSSAARPEFRQRDGGEQAQQDPHLNVKLEERVHALPFAAEKILQIDNLDAEQNGERPECEPIEERNTRC